jgi:antitoxin YefM
MTRMDSVPFTQAKAKLSELVDRVEGEHARLAVTRHGRTAAVLINEDDLESLEETVAILRDEELARSIRRSCKEAAAGKRSRLERAK